ncbi:MAG: methyltransferase domain-containing protein [Spirochaetes bacterium]|nr:methyltransferase domain-containing protein [Spirochaetota bacterium]
MKKIDRAITLINTNVRRLRCPHCGGAFTPVVGRSLLCVNAHAFDIAKTGYVNLFTGRQQDFYDAVLFDARQACIAGGLFDGLLRKIAEIIRDAGSADGFILDAGTGEGTLLARLMPMCGGTACCAGIDISRDGIHIASRDYPDILFCIADIAHLPFADGTADCILNILSPGHYGEFTRVLAPGGAVIKVAAADNHLQEFRQLIYSGSDAEYYSNAAVKDLFASRMNLMSVSHVEHTVLLAPDMLSHVVLMTPLLQQVPAEKKALLSAETRPVTLSFDILVGKRPV